MGGTRHQTVRSKRSRPCPGAKMDPGVKCRGEPRVTRDHEAKPAGATDAGEVVCKRNAIGVAVMT